MRKSFNTIGIVGGAGPMAGTLLMKKIIRTCQKRYGCMNDYDFPKMLLVSYPFSEMLQPNSKMQKESEVASQLQCMLDFLCCNGAASIGIACNTLHSFLKDSLETKSKLINMIEVTRSYILEKQFSKVLILCTKTSAGKNVYPLNSKSLPTEDEQGFIDALIQVVLRGDHSIEHMQALEKFILSKVEEEQDIDGVLLGCSELSVLVDQFPLTLPKMTVIDPLDILARKLCE